VVKDGERAKPAHTTQTFQAAGWWLEHLDCLSEVATFAAVGHCCQGAGLESAALSPSMGAQYRGHGRGGSLVSYRINCLNPLLLKNTENCMLGFLEERTVLVSSTRLGWVCPGTFACHIAVAGQVEVWK